MNQDPANEQTTSRDSEVEAEETPLRRSTRTRQVPSRLAYDRLGHVTEHRQIHASPVMVQHFQPLVRQVPIVLVHSRYQCPIVVSPFQQRIMYPVIWKC